MSREWNEIRIPVPWGHIAGKEYGRAEASDIWFALHGWLDNCGTFDYLAEYFPPDHRLVCLDLPGHGFSSHIPEGFLYHFQDCYMILHRVAKYFNATTFNLMGHSMGGGMCFLFAAAFPEKVKKLVQIDAAKPLSRPIEMQVSRVRKSTEEWLLYEEMRQQKTDKEYTREAAEKRLFEAMNSFHGYGSMTMEGVKTLLKRGMTPVNGKENTFVFTRDLRHRITGLHGYSTEAYEEMAKHIKCPHLIVRASMTRHYENVENSERVIEVCKENNKGNFVYEKLEGHHHFHLTHADTVWPVIQRFLDKFNPSDK